MRYMIRSLSGTITQKSDNSLVIEVRGVGYLVFCTPTLGALTEGDSLTIHTHQAVRETALDLYGFETLSELEMFELLLNIPKIGPKSALSILSSASPALLVEAAEKNDPKYLQKLSGIGKKTCENVVQYLQDKVDSITTVQTETKDGLSTAQIDAIDALVALGYDTGNAREVIKDIAGEDETVNSLVTKALKEL